MTLRTTLTAALTATTLSFGAPLAAQEDTTVEPADIAAADVTEAQVDAFVRALIAIEDVRRIKSYGEGVWHAVVDARVTV